MTANEKLCKLEDLQNKDVINLKNGALIGSVDDVVIDIECAKVISLVIYGRRKCFGLFGRENDVIIPWKDIDVIGEDTVLVCVQADICPAHKRKKKNRMFASFFE